MSRTKQLEESGHEPNFPQSSPIYTAICELFAICRITKLASTHQMKITPALDLSLPEICMSASKNRVWRNRQRWLSFTKK